MVATARWCIAACHTDWQLHSTITYSDTGTAEVLHEVQRHVQVDGQCTWVSICMQLAADYCMSFYIEYESNDVLNAHA